VSVEDEFGRRAMRAAELARDPGAAGELLGFAVALFRAQGRLASAVEAQHALEPLSGRFGTDIDRLLLLVGAFFAEVGAASPPELSDEAALRGAEPVERARERFLKSWGTEGAVEDFLVRAFLRPYVATLLGAGIGIDRRSLPGHCPRCGGAPNLSARRPAPESEALARFLLCELCGGEWPFVRVKCPSCFEDDPAKLPTFQSEHHPTVRIESCESCHRYLKAFDLAVDGRLLPEVDDLASVVIDLWAQEEGFTRISPGVAGF
jgi:formate dehydrogenase accessory protein FdhE